MDKWCNSGQQILEALDKRGHGSCGKYHSDAGEAVSFSLSASPNSHPIPAEDPLLPSPGVNEPQSHLRFTQSLKSSRAQMTLYLPPPPGPSFSLPLYSPSTSTPSFLGPPPGVTAQGLAWSLLEAGGREGSGTPGQSVLPTCRGLSLTPSQQQQQWQQQRSFQARKEIKKEVDTFSTLLLQAAAYVEFIESPTWLVCGGDIQQCLLPK